MTSTLVLNTGKCSASFHDVSTGLELAEALGSFPWRQKRRRAVVSTDSMAKLGGRNWLIAGRIESGRTPLGRIRIGGRGPGSRPNSSPYRELGLVSGRRQAAQVVSATARPDKDRYSGGPQLDVIAYLGDSIWPGRPSCADRRCRR